MWNYLDHTVAVVIVVIIIVVVHANLYQVRVMMMIQSFSVFI